jgi:hypothetical protein
MNKSVEKVEKSSVNIFNIDFKIRLCRYAFLGRTFGCGVVWRNFFYEIVRDVIDQGDEIKDFYRT